MLFLSKDNQGVGTARKPHEETNDGPLSFSVEKGHGICVIEKSKTPPLKLETSQISL